MAHWRQSVVVGCFSADYTGAKAPASSAVADVDAFAASFGYVFRVGTGSYADGQYQSQGQANPAKIISMFEDEEEQKEVASLFNARIHEVESESDMEKALKETIIRIKQNSINYRSEHANPADLNAMMQILEDRKALQQLEKLHISLN